MSMLVCKFMYFKIILTIFFRHFLGEHLPQIQYKNPKVQFLPLKELSHFPNIIVYFNDGQKVMIDCEDKKSDYILSELKSVAGKLE